MTTRLECAEALESLGWALVRYAKRIKRCVEKPSYEHELKAINWWQEARARWLVFKGFRKSYLGGVKNERAFTSGNVPRMEVRKVDIWLGLGHRVIYELSPYLFPALALNAKAWRYHNDTYDRR